jgi:hypothetical protein
MQQHEQQRTGPSQGEGQRSPKQMSSGADERRSWVARRLDALFWWAYQRMTNVALRKLSRAVVPGCEVSR